MKAVTPIEPSIKSIVLSPSFYHGEPVSNLDHTHSDSIDCIKHTYDLNDFFQDIVIVHRER